MYDYYADYDDYNGQYYDDTAGYGPPPDGTYDSELSYELEPNTEPHDPDYPVYKGMSDGEEYESELVKQGSWEEPRCMPRELEDASFDAPALDESHAAWQETWATGAAPDEDEDAWIEMDYGADVREDLACASLPDDEPAIRDNIWISSEREQLQEALERGVISDEEYVRVLGELWDEQLELEQLDERLCADGYVWDEGCDDYVHLVYGCASLEPDDKDVELPLTPLDHMHLGCSVTPPLLPALTVLVCSRPKTWANEACLGDSFVTDTTAPNSARTPTPAAPLLHKVIPVANAQLSAASSLGNLMSMCWERSGTSTREAQAPRHSNAHRHRLSADSERRPHAHPAAGATQPSARHLLY
ncbi:hypothetical protein B0H14DRAFT_2643431 [Mycena olivaceomarginata]|nr:hypothetical protein B0H14DRAFT_2643431 [Mycena olivaceomarginata]